MKGPFASRKVATPIQALANRVFQVVEYLNAPLKGSHMRVFKLCLPVAMIVLQACQTTAPGAPIAPLQKVPADSAACWHEEHAPSSTRIITEQKQTAPAQPATNGRPATPAVYKNVTREEVIEGDVTARYQILCPIELTHDLVANLQRALKARALYQGNINGRLTADTRSAIRTFQSDLGLDSDQLSVIAARRMGLVPYPFDV